MLSRVSTVEEVTFEEGMNLARHLSGRWDGVKVELFESLYDKLYDTPYEGGMFRGLALRQEDSENLLRNASFWTDHVKTDGVRSGIEKPVESWSGDIRVATGFAVASMLRRDDAVCGVVLGGTTWELDALDVVMYLDSDKMQELGKSMNQRYSQDFHIHTFDLNEDEIVVDNPGEQRYELCRHVVKVIVDLRRLQETRNLPFKVLLEHRIQDGTDLDVLKKQQDRVSFICSENGFMIKDPVYPKRWDGW